MPESSPFEYTAFETKYAKGTASSERDGLTAPTWGYYYVPPSEGTFERYVREHLAFAPVVWDKDIAPGITHGRANGYRSDVDIFSCTALVIDCDDKKGPLSDEQFAELAHVRYVYQQRAGKFHLVFPLCEAWVVDDPVAPVAPNQVEARRQAISKYLADRWGRILDKSAPRFGALLHPYSRLERGDPVPITRVNNVPGHLDVMSFLETITYAEPYPYTASKQDRTFRLSKEAEEFADAVHKAVSAKLGFLEGGVRPAGRAVRCPFEADHSSSGLTATLLTSRGYFICKHSHCCDRPQSDFWDALDLPVSTYASHIREFLAARVPERRVTVGEAAHEIREVFESVRPYENTAHVVRVTTGAGKSAAATDFLDGYSAPRVDEDGETVPGRSAVFAVPTNALLREMSERLSIEHVTAQGVLAVLNDDGTPACRKHAEAKALQTAGGEIHRMLCPGCEFKEGCPAREGRRRGSGALTLTNHALLPSIAKEMDSGGRRLPLVVWDECPPMIETVVLTYADVAWLVQKFDDEDRRKWTLDALDHPQIFPDKYRVAIRPLMEVLRGVKNGAGSVADSAIAYGATRVATSQIEYAAKILGLDPPQGDTLDVVQGLARAASRVNVSELMFDQLPLAHRKDVLKAEGITKHLEALLEEGSCVEPDPAARGLRITGLTEHGRRWKVHGGVVLDATAPVEVLKALRPDAVVTDLAVKDSPHGKTTRYLKVQRGLTRTGLKYDLAGYVPEVEIDVGALRTVAKDLRRELARFERILGRSPRTAIFTYRFAVDAVQAAHPTARVGYFGNTRGYDEWFQEGYDVFVTIGDPYSNVGDVAALAKALDLSADDLCVETAASEAAQAHGRARSPQRKLADGERWHLHYGRVPPAGWDADNCTLDLAYGGKDNEMIGIASTRAASV